MIKEWEKGRDSFAKLQYKWYRNTFYVDLAIGPANSGSHAGF
jgi:hypothetical protein